MKFNKQNAKYYGRRGGLAAQAKKARENFDGNARGARLSQELKAFEDFENAESGIFDGFEMAEIFHKKYSKYNAIEWGCADDCAHFTSSAGAVIDTGADMGEEVKKGAENADVLIRCYFLGAAIDEVLPDFEEDFNAAHEEARG